MKVNKIIETVLYCDNVQEMFDFYQNVFNFEIIKADFPRGGFMWAGESVLGIFNRSMTSQDGQLPPHHGATGPQHFAFEIPDEKYDYWKNHLLKKSIPIEKEIIWPGRKNGAKSFSIVIFPPCIS